MRVTALWRVLVILPIVLLAGNSVLAQPLPPSEYGTERPATMLADRAPYRLTYDHISGTATLRSNRGRILDTWDRTTAPVIALPPNRPLEVVIENANPLLYAYRVSAQVVRMAETYSCGGVGRQFAQQGVLLGAASVMGAPAPYALDPGQFINQHLELSMNYAPTRGAGTAMISEMTAQQTLQNVQVAVNSYVGLLDHVTSLAGGLDDSLLVAASMGEVEPLEPLLVRIQESLEGRQEGLSDPSLAPVALREETERLAPQLAALQMLQSAIAENRYTGASSGSVAQAALELNARVDRAQQEVTQAMPTLQTRLARLERARRETEQVYTVNPSAGAYREVTIRVEATDEYGISRFRAGDVNLYTRPETGVQCRLAVGAAWMQPVPEFRVVNGRITDVSGDELRVAVQIVMTVSTSRIPLLGALGGIGIGKTDRPDLYLGGSLRLLDPMLVNFGVVWQNMPRLPDGLSVGQTIGPEFDFTLLDPDILEKHYESGVFLGISFSR